MPGAAAADETTEVELQEQQQQQQHEQQHEQLQQPGGAQMLVSEFPPPPFYYKSSSAAASFFLTPPEIPQETIRRGTQRAAAAAKKVRLESERMRLQQDMPNDTDAILGGVHKDDHDADVDDGDVVAVFGQIVEVRFGVYDKQLFGCSHTHTHIRLVPNSSRL